MPTLFGTLWRVVLIAALILAPLSLVYRSQCREDGKRVDSWSLVAPWNDPPSDCRNHESGFDVLKDEVGL